MIHDSAKHEFDFDNIPKLKKQIAKYSAEMDWIVGRVISNNNPAIQAKFDETEKSKNDLEIDLAKLRIAAKIRITEEEIITWLKGFCIGDPMNPQFRERMISVFINSVYLYDDKVVIHYNVKDGQQMSVFGDCSEFEQYGWGGWIRTNE